MLNAKLQLYFLLIMQPSGYKRTTRFIEEDKVVYQTFNTFPFPTFVGTCTLATQFSTALLHHIPLTDGFFIKIAYYGGFHDYIYFY